MAANTLKKTNKKPSKSPPRALINRRRAEATAPRFLFWPGQKGTIIERIASLIPRDATRLVEPFCGSGVVAVSLASRFSEIVCSDALDSNVAALEAAAHDSETFAAEVAPLFAVPADQRESRFHALRDEYGGKTGAKPTARRKGALLVLMNAWAFGGLVRHNDEGGYGGSFHPEKGERNGPPTKEILAFGKRLDGTDVRFLVRDFTEALRECGSGDFVYCDPPYLPEGAKQSVFSRYSGAFGPDEHMKLGRLAAEAAARGATVVVSNNDSPLARQLYAGADVTELRVARKIGNDGSEKKSGADEILAVWRPKVGSERPPGKQRLRREDGIDLYNERADTAWLDARAWDVAQENGWTVRKGQRPDPVSFRAFNETGRYLLSVARLGTPSMRRLVLAAPGRTPSVSLHLLSKICAGVRDGRLSRREAESAGRILLSIAEGLEAAFGEFAGNPAAEANANRLFLRALKLRAEVFVEGRLETARLPERYAAVVRTLVARRWRPGSETEHRLLLLADRCPDRETADFRKICERIAGMTATRPFLALVPPVKTAPSQGVPRESYAVMPKGAARAILTALGKTGG